MVYAKRFSARPNVGLFAQCTPSTGVVVNGLNAWYTSDSSTLVRTGCIHRLVLYVAAERERGVATAAAELELIEQVDHLRLDEQVQHAAAANTEAVVVQRGEVGALLPFEMERVAIGEE